MLSREEARAFYDRLGARQDSQWFYEGHAVRALLRHGTFAVAQNVFEFGCGTGHVAEILLTEFLPLSATYEGCDSSTTMVNLTQTRLEKFGARARVQLTDGTPRVAAPDDRFDRFVSNYVLDLLPTDDIAAVVAEAHRVLRPGGRLCLVSLTFGATPVSRGLIWLWQRLHAWRPRLVGGCRPIELRGFLSATEWAVSHHEVIVTYGIPSEVIVATKR